MSLKFNLLCRRNSETGTEVNGHVFLRQDVELLLGSPFRYQKIEQQETYVKLEIETAPLNNDLFEAGAMYQIEIKRVDNAVGSSNLKVA